MATHLIVKPAYPGIGRPALTSRATLLRAALTVPLGELTVGEVTKRAGVKYSTFYRHIPSLDALLLDVADTILTGAQWPDPGGPWRTYLDGVTATLSRAVATHPGLSAVLAGLSRRPDRLQLERDRVAVALHGDGFTPAQAAVGADSVIAAAALDGPDVNGHAGRLVVAGLAAHHAATIHDGGEPT